MKTNAATHQHEHRHRRRRRGLKQAIIRTDLDLTAGKAAVQAAHASLWAANNTGPDIRNEWETGLAAKIVLGCSDVTELNDLVGTADKQGLPTATVDDAGRTEINAGTRTAAAIGPAASDAIGTVTGTQPLYK
ncbi:aminoacyl-tRNA hydrolase [Halorubrum halodurans]|uniref:aminoacyl-tRNA hydrolase n=1 Tax=Halorubrum halodurans TaxID=1383851 RepID=UPI0015C676F6|nr:aminoacyl-tRNA hydrolase [Halorubrum halodurans]